MVKNKIYFSLIFLLAFTTLQAAKISGTVANCLGQELKIYRISNFLTGEQQTLDSCTVDSAGLFTFSFTIEKTQNLFIDLGKQQAQIFIAPGQEITADLPNYSPLTKKEYLNPYFEKENILIYDENIPDLNSHIVDIEMATARQLKHVLESNTPSYTAEMATDTLLSLKEEFTTEFLKQYLKYSTAVFKQMAHPGNTSIVKKNYFRKAKPLLNNPAFTQLFTTEYENPFIAADGLFYEVVSQAIIKQNLPDNFTKSIATIFKIENSEMAELIVIKGFYDAANFAPNYQNAITTLMGQFEAQINSEELKALCHSTRKKIEQLMVGSPAPYYELYTLKGKKVPTVLKRRNVLLAFINTNLNACQRQLRLLEKYKAIYKRQIEIVVVSVYQDRKELERFLSRNDFEGLYFTLWDNNEALIQDYDIKVLPTYYFIGKDGKLVYSPLSSPEEYMLENLQTVMGF